MALNDLMAQQIMGEIDTLTKHIDKQISQVAGNAQALNELDQKLIQSQRDLALATAEAYKTHVLMLADAAISAKAEIENQTQAHIDQIKREVCAITDDEARYLHEQAAKIQTDAVTAALNEIQFGIAKRLDSGLQGLEKANSTFEKQENEFVAALRNITMEASGSVKNYDLLLRNSAESHHPIGLLGTALISLGCGFLGILMAVLAFSIGYLPLPERSLSESEKAQITNGVLLEKAWQKMSAQEKERLQKLWN